MAKVGRERTVGFAALPTPGTYAPSIRDQFVSHRRLCRLGQCRDRLLAQLEEEAPQQCDLARKPFELPPPSASEAGSRASAREGNGGEESLPSLVRASLWNVLSSSPCSCR